MAEQGFGFNDVGEDRTYAAADFMAWISAHGGDTSGVVNEIGNKLAVTSLGAYNVQVDTGCAIFQGYTYRNTVALTKVLSSVATGYQRYDRIVVRCDFVTTRTFVVTVIQGNAVTSGPAIPALGAYDIDLASVLINNTSGTPAYTVTDNRPFIFNPSTNARFLDRIKAVDGAGSGVDADTVRGAVPNLSGGAPAWTSTDGIIPIIRANDGGMEIGPILDFHNESGDSDDYDLRLSTDGTNLFASPRGLSGRKVWTDGNDGAGSGMDSDFLRGAEPNMGGGAPAWTSTNGVIPIIRANDGGFEIGPNLDFHNNSGDSDDYDLRLTTDGTNLFAAPNGLSGRKVWTDGNDGAGSGMDSDTTDGYHAGNGSGNIPVSNGTVNTDLNADKLDGYHAGNGSGNLPISNGTVNTDLNADKLDGQHGSYYQDAGNLNAGSVPNARLSAIVPVYENPGSSGTYNVSALSLYQSCIFILSPSSTLKSPTANGQYKYIGYRGPAQSGIDGQVAQDTTIVTSNSSDRWMIHITRVA